jgi:hypothetical protein
MQINTPPTCLHLLRPDTRQCFYIYIYEPIFTYTYYGTFPYLALFCYSFLARPLSIALLLDVQGTPADDESTPEQLLKNKNHWDRNKILFVHMTYVWYDRQDCLLSFFGCPALDCSLIVDDHASFTIFD